MNITGSEAANDRLTVNALAGNDGVNASGLAAGAIQLTTDGGDGDDVLIGGAGNDTLLGGDRGRCPDRRARGGHPGRGPRQQHRDPRLSMRSEDTVIQDQGERGVGTLEGGALPSSSPWPSSVAGLLSGPAAINQWIEHVESEHDGEHVRQGWYPGSYFS